MASSSSSSSSSDLVVIGAGLPRTGTYSLHKALQRLLGGTCYHMASAVKPGPHADFWERAMKRQVNREVSAGVVATHWGHFRACNDLLLFQDWSRFLAETDCRAGVDYPFSFYWKDLVKHFPNAKVILSTRKPETWYKSVRETIYLGLKSFYQFPTSWTMGMLGPSKKSLNVRFLAFTAGQGQNYLFFNKLLLYSAECKGCLLCHPRWV